MQPATQFLVILYFDSNAVPWSTVFGKVWSMDRHHAHDEFQTRVQATAECCDGCLYYFRVVERIYHLIFTLSYTRMADGVKILFAISLFLVRV